MNSTVKRTPRPNVDLVTRIYSLFLDNFMCMQTWGYYLFAPKFDDEPELRNRIGAIWLASLLDSLEGELRCIEWCKKEIRKRRVSNLDGACDQAQRFIDSIGEVLGLYNRDEQLFISDCRDQFVHSWLGRRHADSFHVKYFDGERITKLRLTPAEHAEIVRTIYFSGRFHDTLFYLLSRFRDTRLRYWHVIGALCQLKPIEQVQDVLLNGGTFYIRALYQHDPEPIPFTFDEERGR